MNIKFMDYDYFIENNLPIKQYYDQFETARDLVVGGEYFQDSGIYWRKYKIVFVGEGVALGVEIANGNNNLAKGKKELFHAEGVKAGWKYNDPRSVYRLKNKLK